MRSSEPTKTAVSRDSVSAHLAKHIHGRPMPFADASFASFTDWKAVSKTYKLGPIAPKSTNRYKDKDSSSRIPSFEEEKKVEAVILGTIALKGS